MRLNGRFFVKEGIANSDMTKQEIENYIAVHGNARQVIDTLKAMNAEGVNLATVTESQLTARLNQSMLHDLDYGMQNRSYDSSQSLQPYNQSMYGNPGYPGNINISNQYTAKLLSPDAAVCGYIIDTHADICACGLFIRQRPSADLYLFLVESFYSAFVDIRIFDRDAIHTGILHLFYG